MVLKSAYELASERIIAPSHPKQKADKNIMDFIPIPEFSDREDRVLEKDGSNETKILTEIEKPEDLEGSRVPKVSKDPEYSVDSVDSGGVKVIQAQSIKCDDIMEVCWNGHFLDYGGFSRMNRTMAFGLSDRNVKVNIDIEPYLNHVNKATADQLKFMSDVSVADDCPKIFGGTVPLNMIHPGRKIAYTMIETSESVHPDYAGKLNMMDEIWVPTKHGEKMLKRSNVHPTIKVMPLGVDIERYKPDAGKMNFGPATRGFVFLSVFRWSYRKGYDILLRAFMEEFSADDDVTLMLVSRPVTKLESEGVDDIIADFNGIKDGINKKEEDLPHIGLHTHPIKERDMPKIYNSADAFTLISRGEGFGIPYIEAAACGLPVIASNCSGHSDFLTEENSYLVDPEGYSEANITGNMHRMAKLCHFYVDQKFPDFKEDAIEQTKAHMRYVYENSEEAKIKGEKLRNLVINNYTWDMAVDRVHDRLRELQ